MSLPKDPSGQLNDGGGASGSLGDGDPREGSREIHDGIIVSEAMDWCKKDGAIVPYRLWAKQLQAGQLANSVRQTDDRSHVKDSIVLVSHGDAPGALGITSGTNNAECTPMTWSATVRAEGRNMVRHDDLWWMNHRNTYGRLTYVKDTNGYPTPDPQLVKAKMQVAQAFTSDAPGSLPMPGPQQYEQGRAATGALVQGVQGLAPQQGETAGQYMQRPLENLGIAKEDGESWGEYWQRPLYNLGLKQQSKAKTSTDAVRTSENDKSRRILCHYTTADGQEKILSSQTLLPSLKANNPNDAYYGDGQYLSDIQPGTMTNAQLSRLFINNPFQGKRFSNYVCIDVKGLPVVEGRPHVFVIPGSAPLPIAGRVTGAGVN